MQVGAYFADNYVAYYQRVGSFQIRFGDGADGDDVVKVGGNVASYFCTPTGKVIHAVAGPVSALDLLREARWAQRAYAELQGERRSKQLEILAQAHAALANAGHHSGAGDVQQIHRYLANHPLAAIDDVYAYIFERIVGEEVTPPDAPLFEVDQRLAEARQLGRPVLLFVYADNDRGALRRLEALFGSVRSQDQASLQLMPGMRVHYEVVEVPASRWKALAERQSWPAGELPTRGAPRLAVIDAQGRSAYHSEGWPEGRVLEREMAVVLEGCRQGRPLRSHAAGRLRREIAKLYD